LAESAYWLLNDVQRRALERFRSIGIVRALGSVPRTLRVSYPDDFPNEKRTPDGVVVSVLVIQPLVTPLGVAIARAVRAANLEAARDLEARYTRFVHQLWRYGISHLDFSILNVGITGSGEAERLQVFDPHMGLIDIAGGGREVQDPTAVWQSPEDLLRAARDGSRWALWSIQKNVTAAHDIPQEHADGAAELVREFHTASGDIEHGHGTFSLGRFEQTWGERGAHDINTVLHAQRWTLLKHPLSELLHSMLEARTRNAIYDRALSVLGMHAAHRDVSEFLKDGTKRIGVVGDIHGEWQALTEVLRALGFIDSSDQWSAREGILVFTGDLGHGRYLQEVFDFIHRLAAQAHHVGGKIVWTLGNHDLYVDQEGGQGGEQSLGYRLWPAIREAALHPERQPGLVVR